MEDNTVIVEIVENTQADFITFPVVWLGTAGAKTIFLIENIFSMNQFTLQYLTSLHCQIFVQKAIGWIFRSPSLQSRSISDSLFLQGQETLFAWRSCQY